MATALAELTPNALLKLPDPDDGSSYELSDGELIIVGNAGYRDERVKRKIAAALFVWEAQQSARLVFPDSMFTLGPRTARIPDIAVVLADRLSQIPKNDAVIPIAPDLAVEVISPSESVGEAEKKVREYLAGGVQEIWQVDTELCFVRVRRAGTIQDIEQDQIITSPVLPNFEMAVSRFFAD